MKIIRNILIIAVALLVQSTQFGRLAIAGIRPDMAMLALIGLFVYPVINLIVIAALDVVSKKAIGTAAGFIGLFGYIGRTVQAKGFGWTAEHYTNLYGHETAWQIVMYAILASAAISGVILALTWRVTPKS